jgi:hypothetical protein
MAFCSFVIRIAYFISKEAIAKGSRKKGCQLTQYYPKKQVPLPIESYKLVGLIPLIY